VLGKEHSSTLTSMDNLASVLRDQGKVRVGGRNASTSTRAEGDGAGQRTSIHTGEHERGGGVSQAEPRTPARGHLADGRFVHL
jgi:hypothetical protein